MASSSLAWLTQNDVDDSTRHQLQQLFGKDADQPVDVPKILTVQRKLLGEAERRNAQQADALTAKCDQAAGQVFFMVNMPEPCPAESPCLHQGQCRPADSLPSPDACITHTAEQADNLGMPDLNLFGQCRKGADMLETQQFTAPAAEAQPSESEEALPEAEPSESESQDERQPQRRHPHHALQCPVCAPGTEGGCLNTVTGKCTLFNEFGICPEGTAPCHQHPCHSVEQPCFDPLSSPHQPRCTAKLSDTCRLVDASHSVCLSHACPLGTIENTGTSWQLPFYRDPINYAAGLTSQHLAGHDTGDHQVRLPAGGSSVIAVEDEEPCYVGELLAAGSAWRRRQFPQWESSFVLP